MTRRRRDPTLERSRGDAAVARGLDPLRVATRMRKLGLALLAVLAVGCRRERTVGDRPSQPTLTLAPDPHAPTTGRRVVAAGQIGQPWHSGAWSPASITLPAVETGDVIVVLGASWGDLAAGSSTAPTDDRGTLRPIVDQGPSVVGRTKPPVFAQLYVELDPGPGAHTITPPYLGGPAGDGTLYVAQLRGLTDRRVVAVGSTWVRGTALAEVFVSLYGVAQPGDLVLALAGYDNTAPHPRAGWSHPPAGWLALGVEEDATNNVPSTLSWRVAPALGAQPVTWTWTDPTVNVATALVAALR